VKLTELFDYTCVMRTSLIFAILFFPVLVVGHGGGLDSYGCHHNRKAGGYHCHQGTNAGKDYTSKQEMLNGSPGVQSKQKRSNSSGKPTLSNGIHQGKVVSIADGDTLTLLIDNTQYRIRLAEIDTPEKKQPYGTRARQALSSLVFGKEIEVDVQTTDRYGRSVARVYIDDVDVCAELVRQGMAWVYRKYAKDESLFDIEQEAKDEQRGLWSVSESQRVPPWEWRKK
jgi:endonuclease YncB( thermonuclease family)